MKTMRCGQRRAALDLCQGVENLLAHAVAEIFLVLRLTQIHKRKHRDGFLWTSRAEFI